MPDKKKMSFSEAEDLFVELLRVGARDALHTIRKTACARHITPIQALVELGDPREKP